MILLLASPTPASPAPEPPFTIFDKRQKWLIVFIVSFAATCKSFFVYIMVNTLR
jgi:hypothetical protein